MQSGDFDAALEHFNKAVAASHGDPKPLVYRAEIYQRRHDYERAFSDLTEAIRVAPTDDPNPYQQRASVRAATGNLPGVIEDLNEAIRIDPRHVKDFINRGFAHEQMDHLDRARADYEKAHEVEPKSPLPYEYLSGLDLKEGKNAEALERMNKAVEIAPGMSEVHLNRGAVLLKSGRVDEAIKDYADAIHLDPRSADAYQARATAYDRNGEADKAKADREMAAKLRSSTTE